MRPIIKKIAAFIAILFVIFTFYFIWQKSQPKPDEYELLTPKVRTIEESSVATGQIESMIQVNIKPRMTGILSEIYVKTGQNVKKGDPIARIRVIPDMTALNNAEGAINKSRLNLEEVQRETNRTISLYNDKVVSKEEYEQAINRLNLAKEELANAKSSLDVVLNGNSVRTAKVNTTLITSTINGVILDLPMEVGASVVSTNTFTEGTTIATIADMKSQIFKGKIDETEVEKLRVGMPMKITVGAMKSKEILGKLKEIETKGNKENGTIMFEIKGDLENNGELVFSHAGYSANAKIITEKEENVLSN